MKRWTPQLAATAAATAGAPWMTGEQFAAWWSMKFPKGKHTRPSGPEAIGVSKRNAMKIIRGEREVTKCEALAAAHFSLGFPLPIEPGDTDTFRAWFEARFDSTSALNKWLDLPPGTLRDHLVGYKVNAGMAWPREPDVTLIRALSWVDRCGPFCPWGGGQ